MKCKINKGISLLALGVLALLLAGCNTDGFISVTIVNRTGGIIHGIEVDYPAGPPSNGTQSFGAQQLLPQTDADPQNGIFRYKFKSTGDGSLKLRFSYVNGQMREDPGPQIHAGDSGSLKVTLAGDGKDEWISSLKSAKVKN